MFVCRSQQWKLKAAAEDVDEIRGSEAGGERTHCDAAVHTAETQRHGRHGGSVASSRSDISAGHLRRRRVNQRKTV